MVYPMAWYITWTTYGTWLHGDSRGSYLDRQYLPPDRELEESMRSELSGEKIFLTESQRALVDAALVKECAEQGWILHARNVRTNHVHVVVSASRSGKFVRARLKAIASGALSDDEGLPMAGDDGRKRWWTEKGNIVPVETERALEETNVYVRDMQ
jgi:hypothetical protein